MLPSGARQVERLGQQAAALEAVRADNDVLTHKVLSLAPIDAHQMTWCRIQRLPPRPPSSPEMLPDWTGNVAMVKPFERRHILLLRNQVIWCAPIVTKDAVDARLLYAAPSHLVCINSGQGQ
jgi:hypothetical protein